MDTKQVYLFHNHLLLIKFEQFNFMIVSHNLRLEVQALKM